MLLKAFPDKNSMGQAAADHAAPAIRRALKEQGRARIIAATGSAQFEFLAALAKAPQIDWSKVEGFHLDEYIGLAPTHPASFCKILQERLVGPNRIGNFHFIKGNSPDPSAVVRELSQQIASAPVDIAFMGIGENAHIAFNDPPADFTIEDPYLIVKLDEVCRRQQVGEGWFADLSQVPTRAISMSVRQILKAKELLAVVPDQRKAEAVRACVEGDITPMVPASILRQHPNVTIYLDTHSASLLSPKLQAALKADSQVVVHS